MTTPISNEWLEELARTASISSAYAGPSAEIKAVASELIKAREKIASLIQENELQYKKNEAYEERIQELEKEIKEYKILMMVQMPVLSITSPKEQP